jgi:membrane protein YdbS with pleckstrin-like domain
VAVSPDNQTAPPNLQYEPFMTSNVIVPSGAGAEAAAAVVSEPEHSTSPSAGPRSSIEDEETLWEGRYSAKNFLMRSVVGGLLVLFAVALAVFTWGFGHPGVAFVTYVVGIAVALYCLMLGFKFFRVRRNHHYRLTSRRLFLTTGLLQRRVDQVELVRVKDLFVRQSLIGSWLNVGTVILISSEQTLPKAHLLGIEEPRRVLDLIWRHTRQERDRRTTEVNAV